MYAVWCQVVRWGGCRSSQSGQEGHVIFDILVRALILIHQSQISLEQSAHFSIDHERKDIRKPRKLEDNTAGGVPKWSNVLVIFKFDWEKFVAKWSLQVLENVLRFSHFLNKPQLFPPQNHRKELVLAKSQEITA